MEKQNEYRMSAKAISLYRLRIVIITACIAFLCGILLVFFSSFTLIFICVFVVVFPFLFFLYPYLLYKSCNIELSGNHLCITKGVILLRKYYTDISDINYVGKVITPLQRFFKIFSLSIYTKSGKIYLPNVDSVPDIIKDFVYE
ncbi:MAG: PH domain-containing protein [Acutalibacteraceae bacterium]|nr:PH domain-containing protein [Acutalibacteraceae bacterium]